VKGVPTAACFIFASVILLGAAGDIDLAGGSGRHKNAGARGSVREEAPGQASVADVSFVFYRVGIVFPGTAEGVSCGMAGRDDLVGAGIFAAAVADRMVVASVVYEIRAAASCG